MNKEYIDVTREAYDTLAKEYNERNYYVQDDFYKNVLFADLNFKAGESILEIGPGRGSRLKNFADYGLDVTAVELSKEMCKLCKEKVPTANILNENILECEFNKQFDYIYMEAVIHNFPIDDVPKLLNLIYKWLKDDGILICTTTVNEEDSENYEEKNDYENKIKRFRHRYTKDTFDNIFINNKFKIINKRYKEEIDEKRNKVWQIIYLKKEVK